MNILVCVKQVPDTTNFKIDPIKKTLIRKGVESILNTYDEYSLEKALKLKDQDPENTTITVISMGPKQAEKTLKQCLSVGADYAYLITDRLFGGSDTLATSYILSQAISEIEKRQAKFDLIFCGKQAIDGDTAQVGPEIAEKLSLPQITYATDIKKVDQFVHITRDLNDETQIIESELPALVTFTKSDDLRFPTVKNKIKSLTAEITNLTAQDLKSIDKNQIGLKGSPTKVKKTFTPQKVKSGKIYDMQTTPNCVDLLLDSLADSKIL